MIKTIGATRYGACYQVEDKCPICGKHFMRTTAHVYRVKDKYYCSYTCFRKQKAASTAMLTTSRK